MDNLELVFKQFIFPVVSIIAAIYIFILGISLLRKAAEYFEAGAADKKISAYDKQLARFFTGLANGGELALNAWADGKIKNMEEAKKFAVNYAVKSYSDSAQAVGVAENPALALPAAEAFISRARTGREVAGTLSVGTGSLGPVEPYQRPPEPPQPASFEPGGNVTSIDRGSNNDR